MTRTTARGRDQITEEAADAAIEQACRILRLPTIRDRFGDQAAAAARQQATYKTFLSELLFIECEDREVRRKARLVKQAGFPRTKRIEDFDFAANPNVPPALVHTLAKGAWIRAGQPVCLIGDSGTGKSHLLIGLGTAAAEAGFKVRYVTAAALVNELVEPPTTSTCPRPSPATAASISFASMNSAISSSIAAARSCCFRCSPSGRNAPASRSRVTPRSASGRAPSPTRGSAPRSSIA